MTRKPAKAYITVVALFGSHLQLTNATIPVAISSDIHHRLLSSALAAGPHTPSPDSNISPQTPRPIHVFTF